MLIDKRFDNFEENSFSKHYAACRFDLAYFAFSSKLEDAL